MKCDWNTTWITKEKSKQFVLERIENIRKRYNTYELEDNMEVALISFTYNIWSMPAWYKWFIENNHINALKNMMKRYTFAGGKHLKWLQTRRAFETWLF
jgi:GH24 family phage-related lysozyme (muramidase)